MTIQWVKVDPLVLNGEPFLYNSRLTVRQLLELRRALLPEEFRLAERELEYVQAARLRNECSVLRLQSSPQCSLPCASSVSSRRRRFPTDESQPWMPQRSRRKVFLSRLWILFIWISLCRVKSIFESCHCPGRWNMRRR